MVRWNQAVDIVVVVCGGDGGGGGAEKVGRCGFRANLRIEKNELGKKARMKIAVKRMCSGVERVRFEGIDSDVVVHILRYSRICCPSRVFY